MNRSLRWTLPASFGSLLLLGAWHAQDPTLTTHAVAGTVHYLEGSVDKEFWEQNYKIFSLYGSQPGVQHYLKNRMQIYHPRFQEFLKSMEQPNLPPGHILAKVGEPDSTG